jgi:hypothetical protein
MYKVLFNHFLRLNINHILKLIKMFYRIKGVK